MEIQINYHETNNFVRLKDTLEEITIWTINKLKLTVNSLDIILTSDSYLKGLHKEFFDLNSNTDVITFNLSEKPDEIEGEIYISIDSAVEQSKHYKVTSELEICRLLIHGCLHLAGYDDIKKADRTELKTIENNLVEEVGRLHSNKLHVSVN